jgi:hypothetical protein
VRSNCLIWALIRHHELHAQWVALGAVQGREPLLRFRSSRLAPRWIPHAQVEFWESGEWVIEQWVPDDPAPLRWWQVWRAIWFRGHVRRGDQLEEK